MVELVLPPQYRNMLVWHKSNGVIKATPKKTLSDTAHKTVLKAFKRVGGKYVSHNGEHYFEVCPRKEYSSSLVAEAFFELQRNGIFKEGGAEQ